MSARVSALERWRSSLVTLAQPMSWLWITLRCDRSTSAVVEVYMGQCSACSTDGHCWASLRWLSRPHICAVNGFTRQGSEGVPQLLRCAWHVPVRRHVLLASWNPLCAGAHDPCLCCASWCCYCCALRCMLM